MSFSHQFECIKFCLYATEWCHLKNHWGQEQNHWHLQYEKGSAQENKRKVSNRTANVKLLQAALSKFNTKQVISGQAPPILILCSVLVWIVFHHKQRNLFYYLTDSVGGSFVPFTRTRPILHMLLHLKSKSMTLEIIDQKMFSQTSYVHVQCEFILKSSEKLCKNVLLCSRKLSLRVFPLFCCLPARIISLFVFWRTFQRFFYILLTSAAEKKIDSSYVWWFKVIPQVKSMCSVSVYFSNEKKASIFLLSSDTYSTDTGDR